MAIGYCNIAFGIDHEIVFSAIPSSGKKALSGLDQINSDDNSNDEDTESSENKKFICRALFLRGNDIYRGRSERLARGGNWIHALIVSGLEKSVNHRRCKEW